jgi:hypothetical protein
MLKGDQPRDQVAVHCGPDEDRDAGLCYPKCGEGYHGVGPVCWESCGEGYRDDGALCGRTSTVAKDTYGRGAGGVLGCGPHEELNGALCYPKCGPGFDAVGPVCWERCRAGYRDDGAFCGRTSTVAKDTYGRGAGGPLGCGPHEELNGALCYTKCRPGYSGVGPVCWAGCPGGYTDTGALCSRCSGDWWNPGSWHCDTVAKDSYGRGAGFPIHACGAGLQQDGALCYPVCRAGYRGVGPVCWGGCPAGYRDDGALCTQTDSYAKSTYSRGAGVVLHTCGAGQQRDGALCYPVCRAGYSGVGPVCWGGCPAGYRDDGALCTQTDSYAKDSAGRGVGVIPKCSPGEEEVMGSPGIVVGCRLGCPTGLTPGPSGNTCVQPCPSGDTDAGDRCTRDTTVTKDAYTRQGVVPGAQTPSPTPRPVVPTPGGALASDSPSPSPSAVAPSASPTPSPVAGPANDAYRAALDVTLGDASVAVSTAGGSMESGEPQPLSAASSSSSVWFKYRALSAGRVKVGSGWWTIVVRCGCGVVWRDVAVVWRGAVWVDDCVGGGSRWVGVGGKWMVVCGGGG